MKKKLNVYIKFYYTYINTTNDDFKITLEDFLALENHKRREIFRKYYKQFDSETKNCLSLYDYDNVKHRLTEIKQKTKC